MKTLILTIALASVSMSTFAATCPAGTKTIKSCLSTPQKGDSELAANILDSIAICKDEAGTVGVFEVYGETESGMVNVIVTKPGATIHNFGADGVVFTLESNVNDAKPNNGKLVVNYLDAELRVASTYSCK